MSSSSFRQRSGALRSALRRSGVLLVVLGITGAGLTLAVGFQRADTHVAEASVLVSPLDGNPFNPNGRGDDLVNLETEAQLVASDAVATAAAEAVDTDDPPGRMLAGLSVNVPPNSQIIDLTYTASSETVAVARAQAFADSYLDFRASRAASVAASTTDRIQDQIDAENDTLTTLVGQLEAATNPTRRSLLQERVSASSGQISQLQAQLAAVQTASADPGQIITPASAEPPITLAQLVVLGLAGAIGGILLGLGWLLVRLRAENLVHHPSDIGSTGLRVLGEVETDELAAPGRWLGPAGAAAGSGAAQDEPHTLGAGLQDLRATLLSLERRRPLRLLLCAADQVDPTPASALGLGYAFAAAGLSTVVVDTCVGAPRISEQALPSGETTSRAGFVQVLTGATSLDESVVALRDGVSLVPAGSPEARVHDLVTGPRVQPVIDHLAERYDVVLVAAPQRATPWSQALALLTDATVLEVAESVSSLARLTDITDSPTPGETVLGVVFVEQSDVVAPSRSERRAAAREARAAAAEEQARDKARAKDEKKTHKQNQKDEKKAGKKDGTAKHRRGADPAATSPAEKKSPAGEKSEPPADVRSR